MAINYRGTASEMVLQAEEPAGQYFELSTRVLTYRGPNNSVYTDFRTARTPGTLWEGGYVVEFRGSRAGMYAEAQLLVADAPNFDIYTLATSRARQTASMGRTVSTSLVIPGASEVEANRTVSFIAPQSIFSYWASSKPAGPRFTSPSERETPKLLRSVITATANGSSRTYYGSAPAPLSAALSMPAVGIITSHSADPVPGTPWYRCQDVISWVYRGDES